MAEGWIKIHRQFLEHWLCDEYRPLTKREAWENMLFWANYKDVKVFIKGQIIECKRGQIIYSLETWGLKFNWTIGQVRQFFKLLENDNMIKVEGLKYTTRVTICNYDKYQIEQQSDNILPTDCQHSPDILPTISKEGKERKKEKKTHSDQAFSLFNDVVMLFDENCRPDQTQKDKWVALCEKLLKEYSAEEIKQVVKRARMDDFWRINFQSLLKLDKTNKEGIKYFIVFKNRFTTKKVNDYDITDADFKRD